MLYVFGAVFSLLYPQNANVASNIRRDRTCEPSNFSLIYRGETEYRIYAGSPGIYRVSGIPTSFDLETLSRPPATSRDDDGSCIVSWTTRNGTYSWNYKFSPTGLERRMRNMPIDAVSEMP